MTVTAAANPSASNGTAPHRAYDVLIVGAGFSGIGVAVALEEAGLRDFAIIEKADRLGGTWRDNTYPGCACDVPSAVYQFSFALDPNWSRVYGEQPEIQAYLERVAADYCVTDKIHLQTEAIDARWDNSAERWVVDTSRGRYTARVLVAGPGPLHTPAIPDLPGLDSFEGTTFHSARWRHDHDLTGRRVAVLGTGSSAIQFVPKIQPQVTKLHLFQRTAPWVLAKIDHHIPKVEKAFFRHVPGAQRAWRELLYHAFELVQLAQRRPAVMQQVQRLGHLHLRRSVRDPDLRRALTPEFTLGCKRILMSNTYYPALQRDNVEVVPAAVQAVTPTGVVGTDGVEREVDTIIFGTGFHVTDTPIAQHVRGRDGRSLAEVWNGSPQAYKGTTVAGFPNLFFMIGPNLGNGHSSAIVLIEAQAKYIVSALQQMRASGVASADVKPEAQKRWNEDVQAALAGTVWNAGGCKSYYLDRNGRNASIYPWTTIDLRRRLRSFDAEAYTMRVAERTAVAA